MIEVGILKNFDSGTYKAGVQLAGSLTTYFDDISVARNIPSSALVIGNYVILAIPGGNPRDACVIATWPGGSPAGGSFLDLSDTPSSYSDQAGKYPKVNAAENALEFEAALWTPKIYTTQIDWLSKDGLTTSIPGGGLVNVGGTALVISSGATLNNNCLARTTYGFNYPFPSGKEVTVEFPLSHRLVAGGTTHRMIMLLIDHTALPPTETKAHVGFIIDADSIFSSSADGTTQETQDTGVDLPAGVNNFLYQCKAVVDPGVSVKFYINDVLKTTHTTNPPTADIPGGAVLTFGVKATAAVNQQAGWERIIYTKEL